MRKITVWELDYPGGVHEVILSNESPDESYICIRDDLGETVMIPKDRWDDFVKACQKLEVTRDDPEHTTTL